MNTQPTTRSTARRVRSALPTLLLAVAVMIVGMAGTSVAAKMITGKQIKNNTVASKDIKNNNVSGGDVRNESLGGADVKNGSLAEGDMSAQVKAKLNAPNVAGYEVKTGEATLPTNDEATAFVACTEGKVAIGGGGYFENEEISGNTLESSLPQKVIRGDSLLYTFPDAGFADGWKVAGRHNGLMEETLVAYVICVDPS